MRLLIMITSLLLLVNCSRDNSTNENCQFLLNIPVNVSVNLGLPQFSNLQFPSNAVFFRDAGNGGIIITNTGSGFVAFDAADPDHRFETCSILQIDGVIGECGCEDKNRYSLFTGQPLNDTQTTCPLIPYRVERNNNTLRIFN